MSKLKVLDLFSGAGGLSNGFEQTEQFAVKIAVEIDNHARKTFQMNNPNVHVEKDIIKLDFLNDSGDLKKEFNDIDIVVGGPPCQGFSNANRQRNNLISNNNQLVKEYIRAIEDIKPRAFVMENVRNMDSDKHKFYLSKSDNPEKLKSLQITLHNEKVKIGQATPLFSSFKQFIEKSFTNDHKDLTPYLLSKDTFSKLNTVYRHARKSTKRDVTEYFLKPNNIKYFRKLLDNWSKQYSACWARTFEDEWMTLGEKLQKFMANDIEYSELLTPLESIIEVQKVMSKMQEVFQYKIVYEGINQENNDIVINLYTYNVFKYIIARLVEMGYTINKNYIFNAAEFGVPQVRRRLILVGVRNDILNGKEVKTPQGLFNKESEYYTIHDAIGDLESEEPAIDIKEDQVTKKTDSTNSKLNLYLNADYPKLYNHVRTNTRKVALERFKTLQQGENFHDLDELLKTTYSDHTRTQNTIYKRLEYNKASDTVLNVRKSMWIHPGKDRALSIREAARLQSFQDNYKFFGSKDSQYQQIGNAVPPLLARFIAESVLESLNIPLKTPIRNIIDKNKKPLPLT